MRGLIFLLFLCSAGCGYQTKYTPTNTPPRPMKARPVESVQLFTSTAPTQPFVEVGLLSSGHSGYLSTATDEEVLVGLREKAAEVGCDAVVLQSETTTEMAFAGTTSASTTAIKRFRAVCALFTGESSPPAPVASAPASQP